MTFARQLLGLTSLASLASLPFLLLLLFTTLPLVAAEFTNSFTNLSYGSAVRLTWDTIPPASYPLFITAQLIDKGENSEGDGNENGGGGGVTAYKMNITTAAIDSSSSSDKNAFEWTGIPSPFRWLPEGLYQIELHGGSADRTGTRTTPLAKSPFFVVGQPPPYASGTEDGSSKPATSSSSGDDEPATPSDDSSSDEHRSGVNKRLAFGLGFAIGIPSVVGLSLVSWCLLKRRRKVLDERREEERRSRRRNFVIQ